MDTEDRTYRVEVLAGVGHAPDLPMQWRTHRNWAYTQDQAFDSMRRLHQAECAARVVDGEGRVVSMSVTEDAYETAEFVLAVVAGRNTPTKVVEPSLTVLELVAANNHNILIGLAELLSIGALTANGRYQLTADETKLRALLKALEAEGYDAVICLQPDAPRA